MLGYLARTRRDYERARELFEESLKLVDREADDRWAIARSLNGLAGVSSDLGDHERAVELYEESMALSRGSGYTHQLADNLIDLGWKYLLRGDHERATALNEEVLALQRMRGHKADILYALGNLGENAAQAEAPFSGPDRRSRRGHRRRYGSEEQDRTADDGIR